MTGQPTGTIPAGERYLSDTPTLRMHAGTQPDLFLWWNAIPADAAAIDVVVHLHGFSQQRGEMALSEKVARSGLDLSGRTRPTLALLPRGNWVRSTWYDFPALLDGGFDALIDYGLRQLSRPLPLARLIVTGHSGGVMPIIDALPTMSRTPDELHLFDGLYGHDPALGDPMQGMAVIERWLDERLAAEPGQPGALRVVFIERQTGPMSRLVAAAIKRRLAQADSAQVPGLAKRYRVEPSAVPHGYVAAVCGPTLLARSDADFDWSRV
ncbi:MAG: hypothetical protein JO001_12675 [Alphaproteobacteria bacterium]|nr:hypothetical protein [Alphaproteobacteria bacterium]